MLDLSRMKLRHLPEEFHTLSTLVYLNLSHNLLEEYPEGIFHMPNLLYLNLGHNKLEKHTTTKWVGITLNNVKISKLTK